MKKIIFIICVLFMFSCNGEKEEKVIEVDICVYGGSSAGIIAAYTAKMQGKSVIIIEPGTHLGGLTTGGLGATDIGNKYAITGLAKDFYRRVGQYYDKFEQWTFEPHVASQVYDDLIAKADLDIRTNRRLLNVNKEGEWIREITLEDAENPNGSIVQRVKAKMFIDCTYEGDLMAKAGVSYAVGREANDQYGETFNGVQLLEIHQFNDGIDPYVVPGDPNSGLLWGISSDTLAPHGSGDKKIQAYNFRLALTQDKDKLIPFSRPDNYNPDHYELLARVIKDEKWTTIHSNLHRDTLENGEINYRHSGGFLIKDMPNGITDFNNFGAFSTDMIGANYEYPEGDYKKREEIWKAHEDYTKGLLYFLSHDERVPEHIRNEMRTWGYSKNEFKNHNGFSSQLYIREARRMIGELVMTQKHCEREEVVEDYVGMAAYGMDSHNCQRIVVNGMVKNEGDVQKPVAGPYPISYRAITPKAEECKNLLVPVCVSASHIAFGSIRMEPVFMVLGQSAATAAVFAIDGNTAVQDVDVSALQVELRDNPLADGTRPDILLDNDDAEGITLKGNWEKLRGGYGPNQLLAKPSDKIVSAQFTPEIPEAGEYEIFVFMTKNARRTSGTEYTVFDGANKNDLVFETKSIKELGLSSSEWVSLGTYKLPEGQTSYVEVSNRNADGIVTADAIIWKPLVTNK